MCGGKRIDCRAACEQETEYACSLPKDQVTVEWRTMIRMLWRFTSVKMRQLGNISLLTLVSRQGANYLLNFSFWRLCAVSPWVKWRNLGNKCRYLSFSLWHSKTASKQKSSVMISFWSKLAAYLRKKSQICGCACLCVSTNEPVQTFENDLIPFSRI